MKCTVCGIKLTDKITKDVRMSVVGDFFVGDLTLEAAQELLKLVPFGLLASVDKDFRGDYDQKCTGNHYCIRFRLIEKR